MSKENRLKFNRSEEKSRFRRFLDSLNVVKKAYESAYEDESTEETNTSNTEVDRIFAQANNNIEADRRAYDRKPTNTRRQPVPNTQQYRPSEEDLYEMRARNNGDDEISNEKEIGNE